MLHTLNDLEDCSIHATDGDIGLTKDSYFDDKQWVICYQVVETGFWLEASFHKLQIKVNTCIQ
jgi:hypothetical protein